MWFNRRWDFEPFLNPQILKQSHISEKASNFTKLIYYLINQIFRTNDKENIISSHRCFSLHWIHLISCFPAHRANNTEMILRGFHLHENPSPKFCCNYWRKYPFKNHLRPKSYKISFTHNIPLNCPIILKFFTEHCALCKISKRSHNRENNYDQTKSDTYCISNGFNRTVLAPGIMIPGRCRPHCGNYWWPNNVRVADWIAGHGHLLRKQDYQIWVFSTLYDKKVIPWPVINSMVPRTA